MHPNLGVVKVDNEESFVIADIPGLIEGAADGIGLGIEFLKHLGRTNLLLHLVDIYQDKEDVYNDIKKIEVELRRYDKCLSEKDRWLILNKSDLLPNEFINELNEYLLSKLGDATKIFTISALAGSGCKELIYSIHNWISKSEEMK